VRWMASWVMGMLAATAGGCSGTSSTHSESGGEAGTGATRPPTGGRTGDAVPATGGSGEAHVGGTAGTGGADADTGGTASGSGGLSGSGHTGGSGGTLGTGVGGDPMGGSGGTPGTGVGGDPMGGRGGHGTGGRGGNATGGLGGGSSGGGVTGGNAAGGATTTGVETGGTETGGGETGGGETGGGETGGAETGGAGTGGAGPCDAPGTSHSGGTPYCDNTSVDLDGYTFEVWMNKPDSGCMTVFGDEATFKAEWTDASDFIARAGLVYDGTQPHDQLGTFSSDFAFTGTVGGPLLIGVHGRMQDPPVDFFILEDWVNEPNDTPPVSGESKGTITVDGGTYAVYHMQVGDGSTPRYETYSVRAESRTCGHLSISEHLSQWADMGLHMGGLASVDLFLEGFNGSGSYEFTQGTLTVE
jgi:endo-1,4-beta-xylanase